MIKRRLIPAALSLAPYVSVGLIGFFWIQAAQALDPSRTLTRYGHDVWQREQGLPNNTVRAILQTREGYIWLATEEGLARFDGVHFKVWRKARTVLFGRDRKST